MQIGHGDFGGGQQVKSIALAAVELFLKFRELAGADESVGIHEKRRRDLRVACLAGLSIEEKIDQRTLEPRALPEVAGEG